MLERLDGQVGKGTPIPANRVLAILLRLNEYVMCVNTPGAYMKVSISVFMHTPLYLCASNFASWPMVNAKSTVTEYKQSNVQAYDTDAKLTVEHVLPQTVCARAVLRCSCRW